MKSLHFALGDTFLKTPPSSIITGQSGKVRFKVNASQTAELGKHTFQVLLTGKEGRLQQTLTVNVRP